MPSKSKAQQKFMGMVHALKKGEMNPSDASPAVKKAAKSMSKKSVKKYASTKHKGKPVKVNQEWLEQTIRELTNTEMEGCGYTTSAVDPNYKLKSPGGTGEEDRRLKEAPSKKGQEKLIKVFIDNALKKAGIKVIKFDPMRKDFHSGIWGGFYTVKSNNKVDMKGQGKVKRGSAVLPFYVRKNTDIDLGVSSKDFILGKYSEMSKVVKNLKDFKKTDLDEGFVLTQLKEVKIGRYDIGMGSKGNGITLWNRNVEKAGDYKSIAHIAPNGKITNYEKRQPKEVTAFIDKIAKGMKDKPKGESVNELQKMRPAVKKLLKQKGYDPIFHAIDTSKRQFKQMRYSRGEIQDTLIDMFGDEDPKILQKIKESVNKDIDSQIKKFMQRRDDIMANKNDDMRLSKAKQVQYKIDALRLKKKKEREKKRKSNESVNKSVNENISDSQKFKIYNSLKKGDIVSIKYDSSIAKGSKFHPFLVTKGKTKLMKGKIERIIMIPADTKNKRAKRYLYNRNGSISLALGDMAASIVDMKKGNINEIKKLYHKTQIKNAVQIAKKMSGNMTGAVKKIEKISKGLSKTNTVKDALRKFNESLNEARLDPKQLLQQLGGNRFIAMTGAKNLAVDKAKNTLHMKIGRNSKGVSHLRIKLTGADLYDMEFLQVRAGNVKVKSKEKGVYADQLQKLFTKNTGMYTSL
mgnify:CR=1 FL=1